MKGRIKTLSGQEYTVGDEWPPLECFRCGICCVGYQPQLTHEEVELMAKHLSMSADKFITEYVDVTQVGYLLRQTKDGCVFLSWEKGKSRSSCRIHSFRPAPCRNWQPSLARPQCREGLTRFQAGDGLLLPGEIFEDQEQIEKFCSLLRQPEEG
ncbi:YkgJ family cysteine cluster protein [Chloroflexota bacterium]